mgnify:FL=1
MIDPDTGRFDWMEWIPGPPDRVYPGRNTLEFYIPHDMVGYYNGSGPPGVMLDPNRSASWPYTIGETKAFQHYPIWSPCWTSGSEYWNRRGIAPETVRTVRPLQDPAEPLTPIQVEMHLRAIHDIEEYRAGIGLPPIVFRRSLGTIKEHREVSPVPTSCPSGRMQPLYDALEVDDVTPEQVQQMIDAALERRDAEYAAAVGAKPIRHAQAVNQRLWAIHRDTDPKQVPGDNP